MGWLSGWGYRKSHTVNGSTAGAQTDYQIKIVVHRYKEKILEWIEERTVGTPIESEGVALDDQYIYIIEETKIFKYDYNYNLITSRTVSLPSGGYCLGGGGFIKDGILYIAVSNELQPGDKHSYVYAFNTSDLSDANIFDGSNHKLLQPDNTYWCSDIAWDGEYWWGLDLVYQENSKTTVYKYDSQFNYLNESHTLEPGSSGGKRMEAQAIAFDAEGNAWILDAYHTSPGICVYNKNWEFLYQIKAPNLGYEGMNFSPDYSKLYEVRDHSGHLEIYNVLDAIDEGEHVYLNGKCRGDFGDVRFTDSDGETELSYWIEEANEWKATFWVKIPYIPASPDSATIYIYYGNPDAITTSDFDATFPVLSDDFEDGTPGQIPSGWEKVTGDAGDTFLVATDQVYEGSKSVKMHEDGGSTDLQIQTVKLNGYSSLVCKLYFRMSGDDTCRANIRFFNENGQYVLDLYCPGTYKDHFYYFDGDYNEMAESPAPQLDVWRELVFYIKGDQWKVVIDGTECNWYPVVNSFASIDYFNAHTVCGYPADVWFDLIYMRKWVDPEPSNGDWGSEETSKIPTILSLTITPL